MPKTCSCDGCNKPVWSKGLCKPHWLRAYGKPPKKVSDKRRENPPEPKKRKRIKPVSDKQKGLNAIYKLERIEFLKENPVCKMCDMLGIPGCTKVATQVHHTRGHGIFFLDTSTWLATCDSGHKYEVKHSEEAYNAGVTDTRIVSVQQITNFKLGI